MLYMLIERLSDPRAVYERFRERGRMAPEGVEYVTSYVSADHSTCWQVMECSEYSLLEQWMSAWEDIVSFEVIPVVTSQHAAAEILGRS